MTQLVIFDTETSGFPDWKSPSTLPHQPHIVSLGALLIDSETLSINDEFYAVSLQDGWASDEDAIKTHGITAEYAAEVGIPEEAVLNKFLNWALNTPDVMRVGFGLVFDDRIIRIATKRFLTDAHAENYKGRPKFCCMQQSRSIVDARSEKTGRIKNPTLVEAYKFFTGNDHPKPHHAMQDALATLEVYRGLKTHHADKVAKLRDQAAL